MLVNVVMLAYQPTVQIYPLEIQIAGGEHRTFIDHMLNPTDETRKFIHKILDRVFTAGNRDDRPYGKLFCSVSAGDIVLLGNERWLCSVAGWKEISVEEMHKYCSMERRDRQFYEVLE